MDGLSGSGSDWGGVGAGSLPGMARSRTLYTRSGLAMFLTCCSPRSSKEQSSLSRIWSRTTREMQIPLGSASASSRAATFTPSPKMSCSSTITSPRLTPSRNSIRLPAEVLAFLSLIPRCVLTAQRTASTTLGELGQEPVAGGLYDPTPVLGEFRLDQLPEMGFEPLVRALLIRPHQTRVPRHLGGENCGEAADRRHGLSGGSISLTKSTLKPVAALASR